MARPRRRLTSRTSVPRVRVDRALRLTIRPSTSTEPGLGSSAIPRSSEPSMLLSFERPASGGVTAGALSATLENCTAATCFSPFQRGLERSCAPSSSMSQGAHGYHRGQCLAALPSPDRLGPGRCSDSIDVSSKFVARRTSDGIRSQTECRDHHHQEVAMRGVNRPSCGLSR